MVNILIPTSINTLLLVTVLVNSEMTFFIARRTRDYPTIHSSSNRAYSKTTLIKRTDLTCYLLLACDQIRKSQSVS